MYSNFDSVDKYDSTVPSDLRTRNNQFQRAALLNLQHKSNSIDMSQDASEILGIGESTSAKLGEVQTYLYETEQRGIEEAPPPPQF